jgi:hypothetical protein
MEQFVRKGHEGATFFVGPEIEQTTAFGKKTLFVVGLQDTDTIVKYAKEHNCKHIFLSANRSFDSVDKVNGVYMVGNTLASDWEKQIQALLDMSYMVSIDYPAHKHVMVLEILNKGIWQCRNFVPILSVPVPHVNTSSPNLTIKIDDINFAATNPGVWCMNHAEVTDSNRFTGWAEYGDDMIIEGTSVVEPERKIVYMDLGNNSPKEAVELIKAAVEAAVVPGSNKTFDVDAVLNDGTLGLDTTTKTSLKPDTQGTLESIIPTMVSPEKTADAYTAGTTKDPLSTKELIQKARTKK